MIDDKWEDLKDNLRQKFEVLEELTEPDIMTDDLGNEIKGTKDIVVFNGPQGKMMLTRLVRPTILDKKSHYHKTQGGGALIEYIVSETETTSKLNLYTFNDISGEWAELKTDPGRLNF